VADYGENSVFQYTTPLALNANANLVLGQDTFSDDGDDLEVTDASAISYPNSVAIDTSVVPNRLYVADQLNNRVLGWHDVTALSNDTPADLVIGQPDFVSSICNNGGVSASSLCLPGYLAVDSSGNLYAGDEGNHRVLEYNNPFSGCGSLPCVGGPANLVFGQGGSFTSNTANNGGISATSLNGPGGLALDPAGNLYVADPINSRVLEFNTPLTNGVTAAVVFGQGGSFTSHSCDNGGTTASSLCEPQGIAADASGDIFVADTGNCRVLEYESPLTTDTIADQELGQPDFVSNTCNNGGTTADAGRGRSGAASVLCYLRVRRRGGIRSVIDPSTISAENATVSDRVGCGCTVSAMSVAFAPISSASTVSEIRSPAPTPTIPAPSTRWDPGSTISFDRPSSRPSASARPEAAQGKIAFSYSMPDAFASVSVRPIQATSGSV
jgi:hypothetical protein